MLDAWEYAHSYWDSYEKLSILDPWAFGLMGVVRQKN